MRPLSDQEFDQTQPKVWSFSADLSGVLGERVLLQRVLEAVQAVDPAALVTAGPPPEFRPRMMLTLLTYAYAVGIYGSQDLEAAMDTDRTVRYICARTFPDWPSIRRFRRRYRALLEQSLSQVIGLAWMSQLVSNSAGSDMPDLAERALSVARDRLDTAALMDGADSD